MSAQSCLRCRRGTLSATGAFWRCEACGLAITEQALKVERARGTERGEGGPSHDPSPGEARPLRRRESLPV